MKKLALGLLVVLTMIMISGCSVNNNLDKQIYEKERIFDNNFDEVWDSTIETLMNNNLQIEKIDKENGTIFTKETQKKHVNLRNKEILKLFINHTDQSLPLFNYYKFSPFFYVYEYQGKTKVKINCNISLYEDSGFLKWITLESTGLTESNFLLLINEELLKKNNKQ